MKNEMTAANFSEDIVYAHYALLPNGIAGVGTPVAKCLTFDPPSNSSSGHLNRVYN